MLLLSTNPTPREVSERVNAVIEGKTNAITSVTLTASSTTTTVQNTLVTSLSVPVLVPTTANAAAENWYISSRTTGSFVITHANAGTTDRTFLVIIFGE